jgi:hypothetical protein
MTCIGKRAVAQAETTRRFWRAALILLFWLGWWFMVGSIAMVEVA